MAPLTDMAEEDDGNARSRQKMAAEECRVRDSIVKNGKEEEEEEEQHKLPLILAAVIFAAGLILDHTAGLPFPVRLTIYAAAYLICGWPVLREAGENILHGRVFDENFLMSVASIGAFLLGEYPEAVAVMLFYDIGEMFEDYAVGKSRKSIRELMDLCPDTAHVFVNGTWQDKAPQDVMEGSAILVRPGEKVPLDGIVVVGNSFLDTAALTGEPVPRAVGTGDMVLSGSINQNGTLELTTVHSYGESTAAKILELVQNASERKAKTENFITKFARVYTPAVCGLALALAVIPPLVVPGQTFPVWIYRALSFLVVSCPCALVISVPLGFFGGIGAASRRGILLKGSTSIESLSKMTAVCFDKTGTLTRGTFAVREIIPAEGVAKEEVLYAAACAEHFSDHPIAVSIRNAYHGTVEEGVVTDVEVVPGVGIRASVSGREVLAGNARMMDGEKIAVPDKAAFGTVVYVAKENRYLGCILIADEIKEDAKAAIEGLKSAGIRKTVMLTGDNQAVGEAIGRELGLDEVHDSSAVRRCPGPGK